MWKHLWLPLLCLSITEPSAADSTIKDQQSAVAFAKKLCREVATPSMIWGGGLTNDGKTWLMSNKDGIRKCGDQLYVVKIPINGPLPNSCEQVPITRNIFCDRPNLAPQP
jgi:hypothetical protein